MSAGEKTFAPTAKRRREAAQKGDVVRSRELATAATMLASAVWLLLAGPWLLGQLAQGLRSGLRFDRAAITDFAPGQTTAAMALAMLGPVLALGGAVAVAALISQLTFGEGRWNAGNLAIKPSRLNPLSGLGRMFGVTGWIELAKGLAKVALLGTITWVWAASHLPALFGLGRGALGPALASGWAALLSLLFALTAGLVGIALVDVPIQWLRRQSRLRMSDQDMRDEHKETEGSPEKKAAIRQRQRAIAKGGVQHAMREAQFVLTNPSHFAVAMAYDPAKAGAPLVLAKGRGEKALAMRELAAELAVPTLEYPALARSVYFTTREHQVIREDLYAAVASVLAFVLSLKRGDHPARPAIEVPIALRFDAEGRLDPAAA